MRIIVIRSCKNCPCTVGRKMSCGQVNWRECPNEGVPDWCPYPELPEFVDEAPYDNADEDSFIAHSFEAGFAKGWNTAIGIILKENESKQMKGEQ